MLDNEHFLEDILASVRYVNMSLDIIKPAPYNPRVDLEPDDPEYQQIRASIINHDLMQPIIYNEKTGNAVGGNQRLKILRDIGVQEAVCAVVNLPLAIEMEANIALNRLGNMWDQPSLREVMLRLKESGYDTSRTAFSDYEIEKLTQDMNATVASFFQDDEEQGAPKEKKTRTYCCPHCGEVFEK